jgi:NAD(P)-dependent dehydrogenase (short-subunit alcohol dehydrogenase family)
MSRRLEGRVAIVTGAASGIGRGCAERLANEGAAVACADLNLPGARETVARIEAKGGRGIATETDVSDEAAVNSLLAETHRALGAVDVLHSNAADTRAEVLGADGDLLSTDLSVWDQTMAVNLRGAVLCCRAVLPDMLERGKGSIVITSSTSGMTGDLARIAYSASKAALNSLTLNIATLYGKLGIRCNAVAPGLVLTEGSPAVSAQGGSLDPEDALAFALSHHLTPRLGTPEDVAALVAFLASDEAGYITGQVIPVDGGLLSHMPLYGGQYAARPESSD